MMISTLHEAFGTTSDGSQIGFDVILYGSVTVIIFLFWRAFRFYRNRIVIPVYDESKGHHWNPIDILSNVVYCNVCRGIIVNGVFCDLCGICADNSSCHHQADTKIPCKLTSVSATVDTPQQHHWVEGNLPDNSICATCGEDITEEETLKDFRCCWCQRTVHEDPRCFDLIRETECDLGVYRRYIIPPICIKYQKRWVKGRKSKVVHSMTPLKPASNWRPLIVIGNRKSGSSEGETVLKAFRYILNAIQVIDTTALPASGLYWCQLLNKYHPDTVPWILVAGGDGTIAWVLDTIDQLKLSPQPYVGIIPLGTGNDLANVLGWQIPPAISTANYVMDCLKQCKVVEFDRWQVKISPPMFGLSFSYKSYVMNNYLSIGVDALVALNFHQTRDSRIYSFFGNRFLNKIMYGGYGLKDVLERKCSQLNEKIKLEIDGVLQSLPQIESIVVLNISSWSGGINAWPINRCPENPIPEQSYNDKLLEVIGVKSTLHIGQMMIGLSEPYRFPQGKSIVIKVFDQLPMQVDGEPWLQHPATIRINWHGQVPMLKIDKSSQES